MTHPSQDYGFTPGTYAIYVRIRTNGLGNYPHRARFGIYNSDTKIEKAKIINDLTTSYQLRYVMNYTVDEININERVRCYFNEAIYTTQYYVDYVKFRKIN